MGGRGTTAVLPSPYAALSHPQGRGAHRPRPCLRARPDRVLVGAARARDRHTSCEAERGPPVKVGVPTEIKADEYRVALTPSGVRELSDRGHEVVVQSGAGVGSAVSDADYAAQGAQILPDADA